MTGDIALAGFVLTVEEWQALDARSRAELLAAAFQRELPWLVDPSRIAPAPPDNEPTR